MLDLGEARSSRKIESGSEFSSSTMPKKRSHFYTNAAPSKIEGNVFRYDFDDKVSTIFASFDILLRSFFIRCFVFDFDFKLY